MKKTTLVISSLLVVSALVSPKLVGYKISSSINDAVEAINEMPAYRAEVVSMESGWTSTAANIQVTFDTSSLANLVGEQSGPSTALQITFNASHGPVRWEDSVLGWAAWSVDVSGESLRELLDWDKDAPFYHMDGSAGLLGAIDFNHNIQAFSAAIPVDDAQVDFSGHQGRYNGSEQAYYSDDSSDITVTSPEGTINANLNAGLAGAKAFPDSIDAIIEHALMTGQINGDKAAIESLMTTIFEKQYAAYEFPSQMTKEDITARANHKMEFFLSIMSMEKLINTTDSHYSAVLKLKDRELVVHKKIIELKSA